MHGWIMQAEAILAAERGQTTEAKEKSTAVFVAERFDDCCAELEQLAAGQTLTADEQACLEHFLEVTRNHRPQSPTLTVSLTSA
jgi:hypothetical protein